MKKSQNVEFHGERNVQFVNRVSLVDILPIVPNVKFAFHGVILQFVKVAELDCTDCVKARFALSCDSKAGELALVFTFLRISHSSKNREAEFALANV